MSLRQRLFYTNQSSWQKAAGVVVTGLSFLLLFLCALLVVMDDKVNVGVGHTGLFFVRVVGLVFLAAATFGFLRLAGLLVVWLCAFGEGVRLVATQGAARGLDENARDLYGLGGALILAGMVCLALLLWLNSQRNDTEAWN